MSLSLTGVLYQIARDHRFAGKAVPLLTVKGLATYLDIDPSDLRDHLDGLLETNPSYGQLYGYVIGKGDTAFEPDPVTNPQPTLMEIVSKPKRKPGRPRKQVVAELFAHA